MNKIIKTLLILFSVIFLLASCAKESSEKGDETASAKTAEIKTVVDHAGNTVDIPISPQRIASLHTRTTTVMLVELEAPLIGTATRFKSSEKRHYIRTAEELFGVVLEETDLYNYGKKGSDIEKIKLSKPDLIVATVGYHANVYPQLSAIAPTILVDHTANEQFKVYKDLANWIGKQDIFEEKFLIYKNRMEQVKTFFNKKLNDKTFVFAMADIDKGSISTYRLYGALTTVAYDLGLKLLPYVLKETGDDVRVRLSAEVMDQLNADYFLTGFSSEGDETKEDPLKEFDSLVPGWRTFIHALEKNQFIVFNVDLTRPPVFKAYHNVLDEFEKYVR